MLKCVKIKHLFYLLILLLAACNSDDSQPTTGTLTPTAETPSNNSAKDPSGETEENNNSSPITDELNNPRTWLNHFPPTAINWEEKPVRDNRDPDFTTKQDSLDKALVCTGFEYNDKPTILLVHGTITHGNEQWNATFMPLFHERNYNVCTITYPDRGFADQQISAEYVANAVQRIYQATGRKVAMVGHSQGATMPMWAIRWWPSLQEKIDDFIAIAGPHHGAEVIKVFTTGLTPFPKSFHQFKPSSQFVQALNHNENEAPGAISYTNLFAITDELVQPSLDINQSIDMELLKDALIGESGVIAKIGPLSVLADALRQTDTSLMQLPLASTLLDALNGLLSLTTGITDNKLLAISSAQGPTSALNWDLNNKKTFSSTDNVANINLQGPSFCGLTHITDHFTIGLTDPVVFALILDAIEHPGPADFTRAGGKTLCQENPLPLPLSDLPTTLQYLLPAVASIVISEMEFGMISDFHLVIEEPPLKPYVCETPNYERFCNNP